MKFWLRRRDRASDDAQLGEANEQVMSLEARVEVLVHSGRFSEDHLARLFREGRRRA